jgi:hypothetical protein
MRCAIDSARETNAQSLHPASKATLGGRFDDEMDVIVLNRELHDPKVVL